MLAEEEVHPCNQALQGQNAGPPPSPFPGELTRKSSLIGLQAGSWGRSQSRTTSQLEGATELADPTPSFYGEEAGAQRREATCPYRFREFPVKAGRDSRYTPPVSGTSRLLIQEYTSFPTPNRVCAGGLGAGVWGGWPPAAGCHGIHLSFPAFPHLGGSQRVQSARGMWGWRWGWN